MKRIDPNTECEAYRQFLAITGIIGGGRVLIALKLRLCLRCRTVGHESLDVRGERTLCKKCSDFFSAKDSMRIGRAKQQAETRELNREIDAALLDISLVERVVREITKTINHPERTSYLEYGPEQRHQDQDRGDRERFDQGVEK